MPGIFKQNFIIFLEEENKMKKVKKLIASAVLSAVLVFGAVSTASAFQYDRGDFVIGIMGTTVEMAIEIGAIDYVDHNTMYDIPEIRVSNLLMLMKLAVYFPVIL